MSDIKLYMKSPYLIKISGNDYLTVPGRLMMFRDDMESNELLGNIETDMISLGDMVMAKAYVLVNGAVIATGHATVRSGSGQKWSGREIEKAETAAIGRALAHAGYGTQFALADMEEGDYLADSPLPSKPPVQNQNTPKQQQPTPEKVDLRDALVAKKIELAILSIRTPKGQQVGKEKYWEAIADYDEVPGGVPIRLYEEHLIEVFQLFEYSDSDRKQILYTKALDMKTKGLVIVPGWSKGKGYLKMERAFIEPKTMSKDEINQAKKDLLKRLSDDPTVRSEGYYPNYQHLVNTMKLYKDQFGTEAIEDGFVKVVANLLNRKQPKGEVEIIG